VTSGSPSGSPSGTGAAGEQPPAQPLTPQDVLAQEHRLTLASFDNDDAIDLGLVALSLGRRRALPIVVEVRGVEQVLFRAALPGSSVANDAWIARKARLVERLGHASVYYRLLHEAAGQTFTELTGLPEQEYAAHGGGFPISVVATGRVGVIVVSGLPHLDDHALVVECLETLQKRS
jgi:uncharacterized protein (UPF0303 family)